MRLADHETLWRRYSLMYEKASDTTQHSGLLHKLYKLKFSKNLIKLISSFLSERKFTDSVEGEMSTSKETQAGGALKFPSCLQQCTVCAPVSESSAYRGFTVIRTKKKTKTVSDIVMQNFCTGILVIKCSLTTAGYF